MKNDLCCSSNLISRVNTGEVDISDLSQAEKALILRLVVAQVDAEVIQEFIESGFPVPDSAAYSAITFDPKNPGNQERKILEKLRVLEPHINYEPTTRAFTTTPFDRAVGFGFADVMRYFAERGVRPSSEEQVFERLVRGRRPSVEIFDYLTSRGYQPPDGFLELARENDIEERAPELYERISSLN